MAHPQAIAVQNGGDMCNVGHQLQALGLGPVGHKVADMAHHAFNVEVGGVQRHAARFDLRKIEDVVDDAQQVSGGVVDFGQLTFLTLAGGIALQQVGQPHDGVHWGADFMAHIGQEGTLGLVGRFGLVLRLADVGDVDHHARQASGLAIGIGKHRFVEHHVAQAIGRHDLCLVHLQTAIGQQGFVLLAVQVAQLAGYQFIGRFAQKRFRAHAHEGLERRVAAQVAQVGVLEKHRVGYGVEQVGGEVGLLAQPCLGQLALGDVLKSHHRATCQIAVHDRCTGVQLRKTAAILPPEQFVVSSVGLAAG